MSTPASPTSFKLVEITTLHDDLLLPWLDLYETLFPANERMLVSYYLAILRAKMGGEANHDHLLAAVDENNRFLGLMHFLTVPETQGACLWYLGVRPDLHSQGLGSRMFHELCQTLRAGHVQALLFEVEMPERVETPLQRDLALRRIAFYRRQGAFLLQGIEYWQDVGAHQSPIPMHLMVCPLCSLNAEEAYGLARAVFQASVQQVGPLALA
jgi:GNAT superfamily N-acetyltransferase